MLAAELSFAIAPAAQGQDTGDTFVDAAGKDRYSSAEAVPGYADSVRVDFVPFGNECQGILGIGDLVEATHFAAGTFALAAAAEIDPECAIAQFLEHVGDELDMRLVLGPDKAMQNDERGELLARFATVRHMQDA